MSQGYNYKLLPFATDVKFASWYACRQASHRAKRSLWLNSFLGATVRHEGCLALIRGPYSKRPSFPVDDHDGVSTRLSTWFGLARRVDSDVRISREYILALSINVTVLLRIPSTSAPANCKEVQELNAKRFFFRLVFHFLIFICLSNIFGVFYS